jgi:alcohol dehydrogenase (cytochrome c)
MSARSAVQAFRALAAPLAVVVLMAGVGAAVAQPAPGPGFTAQQADRGKAVYDRACAACHGATLEGSGMALPLRGPAFARKWSGRSLDRLLGDVQRMPPGATESLSQQDHIDILAYLLKANGGVAGERPLPTEVAALQGLRLPGAREGGGGGGRSDVVNIPPPQGPSRLDGLTPVTNATLHAPPAEDWLIWRRTSDAHGFSPLAQINRRNVKDLQVAWTWALPPGGNMMTPLVHDGVLYAYSFGDVVEAFDAATGDLLWRFQRKLERGPGPQGKKGLAIHGNMILVPTSDLHVLALNMKTGAVIWDHTIDVGSETRHQIKSSPLVTDSKVVIGVNGFQEVKGGNFIVALDLDTGKEAWRFHTVARPGEPGGETWNGLSAEARNGGSVWVAGTYDPKLNLVYFGAAPTYDSMKLRVKSTEPGVTNDALYTNATVALDADTGKLAWYYQHQANDQLDHDWAFERTLLDLPVDGAMRRVVLTAGKAAVFDAMDARTGAYLFSFDLGMQNVFASIDPKTGAKTLNPAAIPGPTQVLRRISISGICPDLLGARNLMSTSYDPKLGLLYVPLTDTCRLGENGDGERWQKTPDPASEGLYGLMKAVDPKTGKTAWTARFAGASVGGSLATGGGVVFVGGADRWLRAFDSKTGKPLWKVRLDNAPVSYPVTFSVAGRQYLAVATNEGFVHMGAMVRAAKTTGNTNGGATLWVFALPERP